MRARHTYILRIHRHPTNSQKSHEFTETRRIQRNPTDSEKSDEFTDIRRIQRHPTNSQKSDEFREILRIQRNPTNSQTSYEFTDILWIHRNPMNSQTSYEFTDILWIRRHPVNSPTSYPKPQTYKNVCIKSRQNTETTKRRTRRYVNNSGNVPGPCPIAPRDEISRSGEPLTPIKYARAGPKSCVGLCETCVLPEIYALGTYFISFTTCRSAWILVKVQKTLHSGAAGQVQPELWPRTQTASSTIDGPSKLSFNILKGSPCSLAPKGSASFQKKMVNAYILQPKNESTRKKTKATSH